jgi:hypothetical protein
MRARLVPEALAYAAAPPVSRRPDVLAAQLLGQARNDFDIQGNGIIGSPREPGSTNLSNAAAQQAAVEVLDQDRRQPAGHRLAPALLGLLTGGPSLMRALGERGFAVLTTRWRALQRITASPSRIGDIVAAGMMCPIFSAV